MLSRQVVYDSAKRHLFQLEQDINSFFNVGNNLEGKLKVGWLQDHSTELKFFEKLSDFRVSYPKIQTEIIFDTSMNIEEALLKGRLDFCFLINFQHKSLFNRHSVSKCRHDLYASHEYLKQKNSSSRLNFLKSSLSDLVDLGENLICFEPWLKKKFE